MSTKMPYSLGFMLLGTLPVIASNSRRHFMTTHRDNLAWYWRVKVAVGMNAPAKPLARAVVRCVRMSTASRIDPDNLSSSWKPILDGLVRAHVLVDDSTEHVVLISTHERVPPVQKGIGISVLEL